MSEVQKKTCKVCSQNKPRIEFGRYPSNKYNKRWVDENGKQWSGLVCPDCHRKRALFAMHKARGKI